MSKQVPLYSIDGERKGNIELPPVFELPIRFDIIRRAYIASLSARFQPKGVDEYAGKRTSAESLGVGYGIARVPRIRGTRRAARAPMTVGGFRAHPPKADKVIVEEINRREKKIARLSAIAATASEELVRKRGHRIPDGIKLPIVVEGEIEDIDKTRAIYRLLVKLGLEDELERCKRRWSHERAGRGKMRGRRRKNVSGPLFVVSTPHCPLRRAARNIPGVQVEPLSSLSVIHLAPGGEPGRLTIWSSKTLGELNGEASL
uniref:Large ribosomal subunit protein uL4 n=1 Tax=uncultured korarchaeote TaxID=161241 RepID=A0A1L2JJY0_9CREN|nr:ribosomal protein L4 [uncultured korarchaeote]